MVKKLFKRVLPVLLVVCLLMSVTAFAATTYYIDVTLTGPDADGVTQTITGSSSKYGALSTPLAAEVVQVLNRKLGEIEVVFAETGLREIVYSGLRAFSDGESAWDAYADSHETDVTGEFKETLRDLDSTFADLTANITNKISYLTEEGSTYVVTVILRQNKSSAGNDSPLKGDEYDDCPEAHLIDLDLTAWYHDGIHFCVEHGIMEGHADNTFGPDQPLTRAQVAQILYNLENKPAVEDKQHYDDVAASAWHADAIAWATVAGVVLGYGNGNFGPDDPVTREQLATILYRYSHHKDHDIIDGSALDYDDAHTVSHWALTAMEWAHAEGIITGISEDILHPTGNATRAQAATMFMRYLQ